MSRWPQQELLSRPEAIGLISENWVEGMNQRTLMRRVQQGCFRAVREPSGKVLIVTQSIIDYYTRLLETAA
jgi:hypothetical protein